MSNPEFLMLPRVDLKKKWLTITQIPTHKPGPINYLVEGILPKGTCGDVYGPPDEGRSLQDEDSTKKPFGVNRRAFLFSEKVVVDGGYLLHGQ